MLLTSDGRVPNAVLRRERMHSKVYLVETRDRVSDDDLQVLRKGVVLSTPAQRDGGTKIRTSKTKECEITRLSGTVRVGLGSIMQRGMT